MAGQGFVGWIVEFMRCIVYARNVLVNNNNAHIHTTVFGLFIAAIRCPLNLIVKKAICILRLEP